MARNALCLCYDSSPFRRQCMGSKTNASGSKPAIVLASKPSHGDRRYLVGKSASSVCFRRLRRLSKWRRLVLNGPQSYGRTDFGHIRWYKYVMVVDIPERLCWS